MPLHLVHMYDCMYRTSMILCIFLQIVLIVRNVKNRIVIINWIGRIILLYIINLGNLKRKCNEFQHTKHTVCSNNQTIRRRIRNVESKIERWHGVSLCHLLQRKQLDGVFPFVVVPVQIDQHHLPLQTYLALVAHLLLLLPFLPGISSLAQQVQHHH